MAWSITARYALVQILAAIAGVWLAHLMFAMPVLEMSTRLREGLPQLLAEFIATIGLLGDHYRRNPVQPAVYPRAGWSLHYGCLLVHRLDILCQSRRHHGARIYRKLFRNRAGFRTGIYARADACCRRGRPHAEVAVRQSLGCQRRAFGADKLGQARQ